MAGESAPSCALGLLLFVCILYILWNLVFGNRRHHHYHRQPPRAAAAVARCVRSPDVDDDGAMFAHGYPPEFYTGEPGTSEQPPPASGEAPPADPSAPAPPPQSVLDFSDVLVTDEQRAAAAAVVANSQQIQTVNERFDAAKRTVTEDRLRHGVYDNQERRRLVEALLRRPQCGRRVRSWRTENSDTLRGDVVPRNTSSWGMLRAGHSNPQIDLHPGALGPMAGLQGQWLQAEPIADNAFDDLPQPA